jgi:hypothetical protein
MRLDLAPKVAVVEETAVVDEDKVVAEEDQRVAAILFDDFLIFAQDGSVYIYSLLHKNIAAIGNNKVFRFIVYSLICSIKEEP